jgi:hypothetical protein
MNLNAKFCDPFKADVQELGELKSEEVMTFFERIPWKQYLDDMDQQDGREIHYSPSLVLENIYNNKSLEIAAVGYDNWYIFFFRTKQVAPIFGLGGYNERLFSTEILDQPTDMVKNCLSAFVNEDYQFLEEVVNA